MLISLKQISLLRFFKAFQKFLANFISLLQLGAIPILMAEKEASTLANQKDNLSVTKGRDLVKFSNPGVLAVMQSHWPDFHWNVSKPWLQRVDLFENYAIVAMQSDNVTFLSFKIIKVTSGFNLKETIFFTRWRHHPKNSWNIFQVQITPLSLSSYITLAFAVHIAQSV